jgi:dTDP-4-amino-4,6-dideoxy-D-galactose acyltransferase
MNSSTERDPVCTYLEWDSEFFQRRIARLNRRRLDAATIAQCAESCQQHRIDCVYLLADSDDPQTPRLAEANDFHFTDIRLTLERAVAQDDLAPDTSNATRFARESDLPALRAIARTGHRDTRFYFDEHFDRNKCDLLYQTWIENSFRGFAQAVLVAEAEGEAAAYLTCHLNEQTSQIGLLGVAERHRGKRLATSLVRAFLSWSREQGAGRAVVATQGRNVQAQRLYQRNGFVTSSMQLWYHRWFTP